MMDRKNELTEILGRFTASTDLLNLLRLVGNYGPQAANPLLQFFLDEYRKKSTTDGKSPVISAPNHMYKISMGKDLSITVSQVTQEFEYEIKLLTLAGQGVPGKYASESYPAAQFSKTINLGGVTPADYYIEVGLFTTGTDPSLPPPHQRHRIKISVKPPLSVTAFNSPTAGGTYAGERTVTFTVQATGGYPNYTCQLYDGASPLGSEFASSGGTPATTSVLLQPRPGTPYHITVKVKDSCDLKNEIDSANSIDYTINNP
jgi:hypothetical protein